MWEEEESSLMSGSGRRVAEGLGSASPEASPEW